MSTLTWTSTGATSCVTTGDWLVPQTDADVTSPLGGVSTGPLDTAKTYTYHIQCSNNNGDLSPISTADVTVGQQGSLTVGCSANLTSVDPSGEDVSFTGTVTGGTPPYHWTGNPVPDQDGSYTITSNDYAPGSSIVSFSVSDSSNPPKTGTKTCDSIPSGMTCNLSSSPTSVYPGGSATLTWSSSNAIICAPPVTPTTGDTQNGTGTVNPVEGNNYYDFNCTNSGLNNNTCSANTTVGVGNNNEDPGTGVNNNSDKEYIWFGSRPTPSIELPLTTSGHMNNQLPMVVPQGVDVPIKFSWPPSVTRCYGYESSGPNMTLMDWISPKQLSTSIDTTIYQEYGTFTLSKNLLKVGTYVLKLRCETDSVYDNAGITTPITIQSLSDNSIKLIVTKTTITEN